MTGRGKPYGGERNLGHAWMKRAAVWPAGGVNAKTYLANRGTRKAPQPKNVPAKNPIYIRVHLFPFGSQHAAARERS